MRTFTREPTLTRRSGSHQGGNTGLTNRQKVKVNAALSAIYAEGYDAQAVAGWAQGYMARGVAPAIAYQNALNEFASAQPALHNQLVRMNNLIEASDEQTLARYDDAFSSYIASGDTLKLEALAPMIAEDAVALAVRNGELADGAVTPESVQAALGVSMDHDTLPAAQQPAQPNAQFGFSPRPSAETYGPAAERAASAHVAQSRSRSLTDRARGEAAHNPAAVNGGRARTLTEGRVVNPVYDGAVGEAV